RVARQALPLQFAIPLLVDALETDRVSHAKWEVTVRDIDNDERRPADEVPTAGARERVDARLPPGQADAPRFDPRSRTQPPTNSAQLLGQVTEVREPRYEADRVHGIRRRGVKPDHLV